MMSEKRGLHFLIDYENVRETGLDGAEYLSDLDTLSVFYSNACKNISRRVMDQILSSGCRFYVFRLKNTGKNALDFYIATRVGELIGAGFTGEIIIVSKDKGYCAVKDYWSEQGLSCVRISLNHSVRAGIISSRENSIRKKQIIAGSAQVSIENEYARYQERERVKSRLGEIFQGTGYEQMVANICDLAEAEKNPKKRYIGSLKRFGRADGIRIYQLLKQADEAESEKLSGLRVVK